MTTTSKGIDAEKRVVTPNKAEMQKEAMEAFKSMRALRERCMLGGRHMLPIKLRIPKLQIADKKPGLYTLCRGDGYGKTEFACVLKAYQAYGARVAAYSYCDYIAGVDIKSVLDPDKYDIVMIDRYDLYYGYGVEEMREFVKTRPLYIDCKRAFELDEIGIWGTVGRNKDTVFVV